MIAEVKGFIELYLPQLIITRILLCLLMSNRYFIWYWTMRIIKV